MLKRKVILEFQDDASFSPFINSQTSPLPMKRYKRHPWVKAEVTDDFIEAVEKQGNVLVWEDIQFQPKSLWMFQQIIPMTDAFSLDDVLEHIKAPYAWKKTEGEDVYIAIIDTGICGKMAEFPIWKKADGWAFDNKPWEDYNGHGSMCACIASATRKEGGRFNGVAPNAKLYSCKTLFTASELIEIYEWLIDKKEEHGQPIIASNSWGAYDCEPPAPCEHPIVRIIQEAVKAGIIVVFAAGNNHELCKGKPELCEPDTIWMQNSLDEALSLGTVDEKNNLRRYSSRGPGQCAQKYPKPDCVAPTYGVVMWGDAYKNFPEGWGTSGACAQAAGLAALIASLHPDWTPEQVNENIRKTCDSLKLPPDCAGHGVINCARALESVTEKPPKETVVKRNTDAKQT